MRGALLTIALLWLSGCSVFHTVQTDTSYGKDINPERAIVTKVTAYTLFSSSSELTKFKASQTDKTQNTSVGGLAQDANTTNLVNALGAGIGTALKVYTGSPP